MYNLPIEMKNLKVKLEIEETVPASIESDPVRLQQIINNLMSNATKFADDHSTIEIISSYDKNDYTFKISVSNEGIVIDDEEKHNLFKRYRTL